MTELLRTLQKFSAAEEFLAFFQVPYEPAVVQVHRLHILKRFSQYLARAELDALEEPDQWQTCKALLVRAYEDFVHSTAARERCSRCSRTPTASASASTACAPASSQRH